MGKLCNGVVWVPAGLDLWSVYGNRNQCHNGALFLHILRERLCSRRWEDGFVEMSSELLKTYLSGGDIRRKVIDPLIAAKVIEADESYSVGRFPKSYRIVWPNPGVVPRELSSQHAVAGLSRWDADRAACGDSLPENPPVYRLLLADLPRLSFDDTEAKQVIRELGDTEATRLAIGSKLLIDTKAHRAVVDTFGRRFHSLLTSMKRELRHVLNVDGMRLAEIDISNCQPLLLSAYCGTQGGCDLAEYRKLTEGGVFYDAMCRELGWTRDVVKDETQKMMFDDDGTRWSPLRLHFQERFPSVSQKLILLKKAVGATHEEQERLCRGQKKGLYRFASMKLQRMESDAMILGVAAQLKELHPREFIGTVHDSILCRPELVDTVERVIVDVFFELFGVRPKVKNNP